MKFDGELDLLGTIFCPLNPELDSSSEQNFNSLQG